MRDKTVNKARSSLLMEQARIPNLICALAYPSVIGMAATTIYNMTDAYFINMLGQAAVGAVGGMYPMMSLMEALGMMFGVGAATEISKTIGRKNEKEAGQIASTIFFSLFGVAAFVAAMAFFLEPYLVAMLSPTDTILEYLRQYYRPLVIGIPFYATSLAMGNMLRSEGNSLNAMFGTLLGVAMNLALDPLLIFSAGLGISGAAWATVFGQVGSFSLLLFYLQGKKSCLHINRAAVSFNRNIYLNVLKVGFPVMLRLFAFSISMNLFNRFSGQYGDYLVAATTISMRIFNFFSSLLLGITYGYAPVCGYCYGAKQYRRMLRAFLFTGLFCTGVGFIFAVLGCLCAGQMMQLFVDHGLLTFSAGVTHLRLLMPVLPIVGWIYTITLTFQTMSRFWSATILNLGRQGLFFVIALWLLEKFFQEDGILMTQSVADIITGLVGIVLVIPAIRIILAYINKPCEESLLLNGGE